MNLERTDWGLLAVALVTSLIAGWYTSTRTVGFVVNLEAWTALFSVPIIVVSSYYISRFTDAWGGEVGRGLVIVGIGLILQMLIWVPHVYWHSDSVPKYATEALGLSASALIGIFHTGGLMFMLVIVYGLYVLDDAVSVG